MTATVRKMIDWWCPSCGEGFHGYDSVRAARAKADAHNAEFHPLVSPSPEEKENP